MRKEKLNDKDRKEFCDFDDLVEDDVSNLSVADDDEQKDLPDK